MFNEDSSTGQARRRTRTGCLKCRARKRKCDEQRPVCHSCRKRNLQCVYGTQLSFLSKNARTLHQSSTTTESVSGSYNSVQFVAESTPNRDENAIVCSPAVKRSSSAQKSRNVKHVRHHARFHVGSPTHISSSIGDRVTEAGWSESSPAGPPQLSPSSQTSFDEHYEESAAQGLLALGHSTIENIPTDTNTSTSIYHSLEDTHPSGTVDISPAVSSGHLDHLDSIDSDQILEFLKHFRYEVAPWLDIYDMSHSFGILVPGMATVSRELLFALLALSADSMALITPPSSRLRADSKRYADISESYRDTESTPSNLHREVAAVLMTVYHYTSGVPEKLIDNINRAIGCLSPLPVNVWESSLTAGIRGLLLRLDISSALRNNTALRLSLPANGYSPSPRKTSQSDTVFYHGQYVLALCAQALQLRSRTLETPLLIRSPGPGSFIERWKMLVESLSDWYNNRPQDFRPMLEVTSTEKFADIDHAFPLILFTNSAAVFANQMFHTAMFLLLEQKPRTLRFTDNHNIVMSPFWNVHRICGIAMNNDRRECWDPSLVASLFVAAKQMTHESQQNIIEQGFFRIQRLTGWDISEPLAKLHETWKLAEAT